MGFVQKTWKDRVAEYINRRTLTKEDGTTEVVTVARSEGTVSQEGDAFSADNMNDLEQRIADEFSELNSSLTADGTPFRFGKDSEGNFGYIITDETGADSVIPFKKGDKVTMHVKFWVSSNIGYINQSLYIGTNSTGGVTASHGQQQTAASFHPNVYSTSLTSSTLSITLKMKCAVDGVEYPANTVISFSNNQTRIIEPLF